MKRRVRIIFIQSHCQFLHLNQIIQAVFLLVIKISFHSKTESGMTNFNSIFHESLKQFPIEHDIENIVKLFTPSHNYSNTIVTVNGSH